MEAFVRIALGLLTIYAFAGLLFAIAFQWVGLSRVDPAVKGAGIFFRLLITPGMIALWPLLARRWRRAAAGGSPFGDVHRPLSASGIRRFHRRLVYALVVLLPLIAGAGVLLRPAQPRWDGSIPEQLSEIDSLPEVRSTHDRPFASLPITLRLRGAVVELEVAEDLERPTLGLYWSAGGNKTFLGAVWGPATLRFRLPRAAERVGGELSLYSMIDQQQIAGFSMNAGPE